MRKAIGLFVLLSIFFTSGVFLPMVSASEDITASYSDVYDIYGNWAENDINDLLDMGIIKGDGNFNANPERNITRAEFTALLIRALTPDMPAPTGVIFNDVKPSDWYYAVTGKAQALGLVEGFNGNFRPASPITREEIMLIISRLDIGHGSANIAFKDIPPSYRYRDNLARAVASGIIKGYADNTFRPVNNATRAESAAMVRRLLDAMGPQTLSDSDLDELKAEASKYLSALTDAKNSGASPSYNIGVSTGKELENNLVRAALAGVVAQSGVTLNQTISGLTMDVTASSGAVVKLKADYFLHIDRTYPDGGTDSRDYNAETDIGMVNLSGGWRVYNTQDRIYRLDGTNLTWDYVSGASPDLTKAGAMPGLDVLSPTWYELADGNVIKQIPSLNYVNTAHNIGYEVWPLFKNTFGSDATSSFLKDGQARNDAVYTMLLSMLQNKLDGLNVDFEDMDVSNKPYFSQFLRELAFAGHYIGAPVSVDVTKYEPGSYNWSLCYDRTALGKYSDYVILMSYDQNGSWSTAAGSVAQLSWVEDAVKLTLNEVPAHKLLLGLPFYTRLWQTVNGRVVSTKAISMQTAQDLIRQNNATLTWDASSGQNIATWYAGDSKYSIWVEDAQSIGLKAALVGKYGLAGTASWRRGYETADVWPALAKAVM